MKTLRRWWSRFLGMFSKQGRERELADELASHLQMHIDDNLRAGMTPAEARRAAMIKLGGLALTKEAVLEARTVPQLENLAQDLRYAVRQLRKNPGFSTTAVFILALGVCASVSIFAFVDAALIKPLPYRDPSRLVDVAESVQMFPRSNLSYFDYLDWKKQNKSFESLEAYTQAGLLLKTPTGAVPLRAARVSDGFFRALGVSPAIGRDFAPGEDLASAARTVMLSYAAWQKRYEGKDSVLGQSVTLDDVPHTIIGVLPPDFHFAPVEPVEFWTPLNVKGGCEKRRSCHNLYGVARLKEGTSFENAAADVTLIARQLEQQYPDSNRGQGATLAPLTKIIVGDLRPILYVLLGGAGLLLLIATVNVASLLLVRSESRRREIAVRSALGATPARLLRQFATEGAALVAAGCGLGLLSAYWLMQFLTALIPKDMFDRLPYLHGVGLNVRVLAFAGLISVVIATLFSLAPSFRLSLSEMREGLAESGRGSAGTLWRRLGSKLVAVELALAVVLLVGAGLLGKSLYRLLSVEIGFEPDHLATMWIGGPNSTYGKDEQAIALQREVLRTIESLPGVQSIGATNSLPVSHNGNTTWLKILGRPWNGEHNETPQREISAGYFKALGAKLLRGRSFEENEDGSKPPVVIINQTFANQYFPNEDPIGKQISHLSDPPQPIEIVGVVEDIKEGPLDLPTPRILYKPFNQSTDNYFAVVVRTSQAASSLLPSMVAAVRQINPDIVSIDPLEMNDRINNSPAATLHRSMAWLVGGFAALALVLGVVGLYGVIAYSVSQRTREIGVRMALGAQRSSVVLLILKEAGGLAAAGIVVGMICAVGAAMAMRTMLFGVSSWDAPTLIGVAVVLAFAAVIASIVPARRAASVNPVEALRAE
jgi:macrolide transport system ATP-binding/permease protein